MKKQKNINLWMEEIMIPFAKRKKWLLKEIKEYGGVDVLNKEFVIDYITHTKAIFIDVHWGAPHCRQLGLDMAKLAKAGLLDRRRLGLSGGTWMPGWPKWVWVYRLKGGWDAE